MSGILTHNSYGKRSVRVSKIKRPRKGPANTERHEFIEAAVDVLLEGEFAVAYTAGDNRPVIATDTCKNTVYVIAKDDEFETIESYGLALATHFVKQYQHVSKATIHVEEHAWKRLMDSHHCFIGGGSERPTVTVVVERNEPPLITAGFTGLQIAKTTESGFSDFHQDEFRTLADTSDRIFATELSAEWVYDANFVDFTAARETLRSALLAKFIDHFSRSVQETLYLMGQAALATVPQVREIRLAMPNKHHLLANLAPFKRTNENQIFVATSEPFGYITGVLKRE